MSDVPPSGRRGRHGCSSPNSRGRGLPKCVRLRRRREFLEVQKRGRNRHTPHFIVVIRARGQKCGPRFGVTVSRRVGNAVARNRIKRRVREFFRHHRERLPIARDFVFIARTGAEKLSYADIVRELCGGIGITADDGRPA